MEEAFDEKVKNILNDKLIQRLGNKTYRMLIDLTDLNFVAESPCTDQSTNVNQKTSIVL